MTGCFYRRLPGAGEYQAFEIHGPHPQQLGPGDPARLAPASIGPDGVGATTGEIFDRTGFVGTSAQTLLVRRRDG
ncbi:hypothetical protein BST16_24605 [Mycobacterium asiaticum DSM 44297]|nr:hypothetical protein BST16_24605 [Mycobacterium asiaticum DSM 44297]